MTYFRKNISGSFRCLVILAQIGDSNANTMLFVPILPPSLYNAEKETLVIERYFKKNI